MGQCPARGGQGQHLVSRNTRVHNTETWYCLPMRGGAPLRSMCRSTCLGARMCRSACHLALETQRHQKEVGNASYGCVGNSVKRLKCEQHDQTKLVRPAPAEQTSVIIMSRHHANEDHANGDSNHDELSRVGMPTPYCLSENICHRQLGTFLGLGSRSHLKTSTPCCS